MHLERGVRRLRAFHEGDMRINVKYTELPCEVVAFQRRVIDPRFSFYTKEPVVRLMVLE